VLDWHLGWFVVGEHAERIPTVGEPQVWRASNEGGRVRGEAQCNAHERLHVSLNWTIDLRGGAMVTRRTAHEERSSMKLPGGTETLPNCGVLMLS
jgi:hypothetical protein